MALNRQPKERTCEAWKRQLPEIHNTCERQFTPQRMGQKVCSVACSIAMVNDDKAKGKKRQQRVDKRAAREASLDWWVEVGPNSPAHGGNAPFWLHKWICRVRDKFYGCIYCGSMEPKGGIWHACHFRSRGAAGHIGMRLNPNNIHKGCKNCNTGTTGDSGAAYRRNLVDRYGEEYVRELDENNEVDKRSEPEKIDQCRAIRDDYRQRCKDAGVDR